MISLLTLGALAQNVTSGVTGVVTDSSGALVVGASVVARNTATGLTFPTKTNKSGIYNLASLPPGPYTLAITGQGYGKSTVPQFALESAQTAHYNIQLVVGEASTTVVVSSAAPILNTQDATLSTTLGSTEISKLPLVADNIMTLGLLTPGAIQPNPGAYDNIYHSTGFSNQSFNVNGNREQSNNFTLDGLDINDAIDNWMAYTPSRNSLQEYQMITGNNTAEYGNANGGQVVMTTKSGTNQFHGSAFFQMQNTLLNANSWLQKHTATITPRQPLNRTYFGGTLGGPLMKNKLFFFVDYRGVRQHQTGVNLSTQPDPAYLNNPAHDETGQAGLKGTGTAYDPYLNTTVPISNPAAEYLLQHPTWYPVCNQYNPGQAVGTGCVRNSSGANYEGFTRNGTLINQGDVKLDWRLRESDMISGRFTRVQNSTKTTAVAMPVDTPLSGDYPYIGFVVNWTHTISPNLLNEARVGYSRSRYTNYPVDITGLIGTTGLQNLGIPGPTQVFPGVPTVTFSGTGPAVGSFGPSNGGRATDGMTNAFTYGDKISWFHGRNSIKFGAQAVRYQENRYYSGNIGPLGSWTFTGSTTNSSISTGSAWADFLEDKASAFSVGSSSGRWGARQWRPAIYFQDDYKALPNLTFNLGVRWEYDQPMYEVNNRQSNTDPSTGAITFAGVNGASRALYNSYWLGFMPRVGFAYTPGSSNRLVIRAGYGITNYMEGMGAGQRLTQNPFFIYSAAGTAVTTPEQMSIGYPALTAVTPATLNSNLLGWDVHLKPALVQQFDLILAYQISNTLALQAGYVGQDGDHLANLIGLNQAPCSILATSATSTPCNSPLATKLPALANHNVQYTQSEGVMNYNALQVTLRKNTTHNIFYLFNYTFSKSMTDSSGYYGSGGVLGSTYAYPQDSTNLAGDYGPSYFDARHLLSFAVTYKLPFGRGELIGSHWNRLEEALLGGWNTSMTGNYHTGFAQSVYSTTYYKVNGASANPIRANQYRPLKIVNRSYAHWLGTDPSAGYTAVNKTTNTSAVYSTVASPANPTMNQKASSNVIYTKNDNGVAAFGEELSTGFGTSHVGVLRDPGYHNFNAAMNKDFALPGSVVLGFRVDAYNVFNGVSWAAVESNISNSSFGAISSSGTSTTERHLQLALTLKF
ncbi:MAG: TonB-dependent receptor [Acidobacteriaceae bacterium]|nr:TonB-dependent receptor [Acidobacteriaceae bacterium]